MDPCAGVVVRGTPRSRAIRRVPADKEIASRAASDSQSVQRQCLLPSDPSIAPIDRIGGDSQHTQRSRNALSDGGKMMKTSGRWHIRPLVLAIAAATTAPVAAATSCQGLAALAFPDTTITAAQMLLAG